jgi:hypothetical protein
MALNDALCMASTINILLIDHDLGGGTNVYTRSAIEGWINRGLTVNRLTFDRATNRYVLHSIGQGRRALVEHDTLDDVLEFFGGRILHSIIINSLVTFPSLSNSIEVVLKLKKRHNAKLSYHMHDFYCICPSQHLLNRNNVYCGIPEKLEKCKSCAKSNMHMWGLQSPLFSIIQWRYLFQALLEACDQIIFFDESSAVLALRQYGSALNKIKIKPHKKAVQLKPVKRLFKPEFHIGFIGTLNLYKGAARINQLAEYIECYQLETPMTLVGSSSIWLHPNITSLGKYDNQHLSQIIEISKISVFLVASIAPETFCYALDELMSMRLPIVAFDLGAQGRRTKLYSHGKVIPLDSTPGQIYNHLALLHSKFYLDN